jgi:WD40-like Beta Propeller Repeat
MTSDRAAKNAARARMARTGEPYTVARRARGAASKQQPQFQHRPSDWHFVALGMHHALGPWQHHPTVRDALTGTVTAIVSTPPAVQVFYRVTSAGAVSGTGEQLHVLAGQQAGHADAVSRRPHAGPTAPLLYALRVDAGGQAADLAAIPAESPPREGPGSPSIAVTADGTRLLYAQARHREGFRETTLYLVEIVTGQSSVLADAIPGQISEPSWAGDGRTMAFEWNPGLGRVAGGAPGIYVVNAAEPADWDAAGRLVMPLQGVLGELIAPVISRDGTAVYVTAAQADLSGGSHWNRLLEVPVSGGEPRTLFELRYQANPANLAYMWTDVRLDPSGRFLLLLSLGWAYLVEIATAATLRIPYPL